MLNKFVVNAVGFGKRGFLGKAFLMVREAILVFLLLYLLLQVGGKALLLHMVLYLLVFLVIMNLQLLRVGVRLFLQRLDLSRLAILNRTVVFNPIGGALLRHNFYIPILRLKLMLKRLSDTAALPEVRPPSAVEPPQLLRLLLLVPRVDLALQCSHDVAHGIVAVAPLTRRRRAIPRLETGVHLRPASADAAERGLTLLVVILCGR